MLKKYKKTIILTTIVMLLPILIGFLLWDKLPDKVPIHWNAAGEIDGWSSKGFAIFGIPVFLFAVHWICLLMTKVDPKHKNHPDKMMRIVLWICPVISVFMCIVVYGTALGMELMVDKIVIAMVGLMFIIVGNYLPKCQQSYTLGIKIPWTLNDEENWNYTHRIGGRLWVVCGFVFLVSMLLPTTLMIIVELTVFAVAIAVPTICSYLFHRRKKED